MQIPSTPAQATAFTHSQQTDRIGTAVAAKALEVDRQQGAAVLRLLSAAAGVGRSTTATPNGLGGQVDVVA